MTETKTESHRREEDLQRCILGRYKNQSINIKKLENQMRSLKTLNNTKTNRGIPNDNKGRTIQSV